LIPKQAALESAKLSKLQREKPYVWEKMQHFDEKISRGESIAIIRLEYRYACNFKCSHCCVEPFRHKTGRQLTPETVRTIAVEADRLGLARFVITGGEPLIIRELNEVIAAIDPQKHYINIDTNGWYLTLPMAKHLKTIGVDRIQLSIDSFYETEHDLFRNAPGSHRMALRASDHALAVGLDLFIQTVVGKTRLYSDEFIKFMEYWNGLGVGVFVTFLKPVGAAEGLRGEMCGAEDFAYFRELEKKYNVFWHLTNAYGRDIGCIACKSMVSITAFGQVMACLYGTISIGDIFKEPLGMILERGMKTPPYDKYIGTCPMVDRDWQGPF